jgi:hypothetical protein
VQSGKCWEGQAIRPDCYLPELDVYIENWGMDTADYKIGMLKKQQLYEQEGKRLVSLYWKDKPRLRELLAQKLAMFMGTAGTAAKPMPACFDAESSRNP